MTFILSWNGHAKMTRKDMWAWCLEGAPSKEWLKQAEEKQRTAKGSYYEFAAVRAAVNCGNLILGVYDAISGRVTGCYYMTPSGNHHASKNGKDWYQDKIRYLPLGGFSYYTDAGRVEWLWLDGYEETDMWLNENELDDTSPYGMVSDDPIRRLDWIEANLSRMRRQTARERREQRISDWVQNMAYLPDGFTDWVESTAFEGRHFAFWDRSDGKHGNRYHCSACGRLVSGTGWKQGKEYACPLCGATVKVRKTGSSHRKHARASYFYPCKSMAGRDRVAMVTVCVTKHWNEQGERTDKSAERILLIPTDGSPVYCEEIYYNHGCFTWSDRNSYGFRTAAGYLYLPDPTVLRGTIYEDMLLPVTAASERGWRLNYDYLMLKSGAKSHIFEYLIKGGFKQLTTDLVRGAYYDPDGIKWSGKTVDEVLLLNGQSRARLRAADGGLKYLTWLRCAEMCGYKLSDQTLAWLAKNLTPTNMAWLLNGTLCPPMSVEKVVNYVKKQLKLAVPARAWYYGTRAEGLLQSWRDYLGMAKSLGLDLSREAVYKPKDLRARHDELAEILAMRERRAQLEAEKAALAEKASKMEAKYPKVAPVCARVRELYEWGDGTYLVKVPAGAWDVMQEGVLQRHCTSRDEENVYLERIEQETSYIMFLRKADKPDSPWYTMEVEPGGNVIQLRTYGDKEGTDRAEAKAFLGKWRREIAGRLGQGELTKTQKSREELLKYWDGLRKGGNIIRRGHLQGKLLVEVLQADYKELNGELPTEEVG